MILVQIERYKLGSRASLVFFSSRLDLRKIISVLPFFWYSQGGRLETQSHVLRQGLFLVSRSIGIASPC